MQMQQSMRQLQSSGLMPPGGMMGFPGAGMGAMGPMGFGSPSAGVNSGLDFSSLLSGPGTTPAVANGGYPSSCPSATANPSEPPSVRFASQLRQLGSMGFTDSDRNIRVLQQCNGCVNAAIERLLNGSN
jgi:ubiquilin